VNYIAVDVDGTLTHSNISFAFGRYMYKEGLISFFDAMRCAYSYFAHTIGLLSMQRLHASIFRSLFLGRRAEEIRNAADRFFEEKGKNLFKVDVAEEILLLQKEGARVMLLSSSPDFLVERVADYIGVEEWSATEYVVRDEIFSKLGKIITGSEKAKIAADVRSREGSSITIFTNSMLDLPLIQIADHVVAVAPDRRLLRLSKQKGWRVL
jgi:phosphoserine phosphatase